MSAANDLMVHELTARFSSHRIFLFDTMEKLGTWRTTLDIVILPMDVYAYVLEQRLPWLMSRARSSSRRSFKNTVSYLLSKIHDSLEPDGCFPWQPSPYMKKMPDFIVVIEKDDKKAIVNLFQSK